MRAIEQSCFWLATRAHFPAPPLAGEQRADIAIIGGGFTGLWTALFLKELAPDAEIILLEQAVLGYGGSGRNAGQVSGTLDHSHKLALAHFGLDEARRMAHVGLENLDCLEQFLRQHHIDCDFARAGQLTVALTATQVEELPHLRDAGQQLGVIGLQLLNAEQTRAELNSPLYLSAMFDPHWAQINPIQLVDGLKREAQRRGVRICERSPAVRVAAGRVITDAGKVEAGKIVLATNAYTHHLFPRLLRRYLPLYDYILVSDPLTPAQRDVIGWQRRQVVVDLRTFFNYYRLTADHRILWGTSEAMYYRGNRVDESCDHSGKHYAELLQSFRRHFPQIADLNFPYQWGGPIASTSRFTPFFGTLDGGRIHYGLGYTGLGIAAAHLAGKILAHQVTGRASPLLELALVRRPPFPYPPEPLRSWAVGAVTRALRRVDAGGRPSLVLRALDKAGIGFSS